MLEFERSRGRLELEWIERVADLLESDISVDSIRHVLRTFCRLLLFLRLLRSRDALLSERRL